jgi:hypothetical protein
MLPLICSHSSATRLYSSATRLATYLDDDGTDGDVDFDVVTSTSFAKDGLACKGVDVKLLAVIPLFVGDDCVVALEILFEILWTAYVSTRGG